MLQQTHKSNGEFRNESANNRETDTPPNRYAIHDRTRPGVDQGLGDLGEFRAGAHGNAGEFGFLGLK